MKVEIINYILVSSLCLMLGGCISWFKSNWTEDRFYEDSQWHSMKNYLNGEWIPVQIRNADAKGDVDYCRLTLISGFSFCAENFPHEIGLGGVDHIIGSIGRGWKRGPGFCIELSFENKTSLKGVEYCKKAMFIEESNGEFIIRFKSENNEIILVRKTPLIIKEFELDASVEPNISFPSLGE